jgi:hypothetical protein
VVPTLPFTEEVTGLLDRPGLVVFTVVEGLVLLVGAGIVAVANMVFCGL